ncbi:uncharacterized protein LACBIDRAFT_315198 [Laccaria bicolor S238N-H82]|uniref:Predicted protein n=1 Tax=Laccaria bicolor (strain S238N-H82 / ATCC MYA-4686) TaxID=486041 RepID=B0E024_LACBS|nr:uncharacterized protein LACBIDRAFT_315198 [Laccaria bicolor S238N-H82]EDQ99861.1 predicted protein [Laccaria bicolor S238N-H82]|eukprot:XP_001889553.1 predicted protein [Laccaria bicolor S238N-H82]
MAVKTHTWISLWFLITVPVVAWDVGYCFMRPRSMKGGDLHWIWKPYALYQEILFKKIYGLPALNSKNGFTNAQALLNVIETFMNIAYLYLAHVAAWPPATLIGFGAALMTLSKTVLYGVQEYYCGYCAVGHNDFKTLFVYWVIPNGLWIVFPILIVAQLGKDLVDSLNLAAKAEEKFVSKKIK